MNDTPPIRRPMQGADTMNENDLRRRIIEAHDHRGRTPTEIALDVGVSLQTVSTVLTTHYASRRAKAEGARLARLPSWRRTTMRRALGETRD